MPRLSVLDLFLHCTRSVFIKLCSGMVCFQVQIQANRIYIGLILYSSMANRLNDSSQYSKYYPGG